MKLFYTPNSPYARKIRILLREKGLACEEVQASLNDATLSALNPLGKVPTLVADDQTAMFDSVVISEYLELIQPEPCMIPIDKWERVVVRKWEAIADGISDVLVALKVLDAELAGHGHAHGNQFTLADAALVAAVGYVTLRRPQLLQGLPALLDYAQGHAARPSVLATIPPG